MHMGDFSPLTRFQTVPPVLVLAVTVGVIVFIALAAAVGILPGQVASLVIRYTTAVLRVPSEPM